MSNREPKTPRYLFRIEIFIVVSLALWIFYIYVGLNGAKSARVVNLSPWLPNDEESEQSEIEMAVNDDRATKWSYQENVLSKTKGKE